MEKNIQNYFTSVEQSKKLIELGVPPNSADCYWEFCSDKFGESCEYDFFVGENAAIKNNLLSFRNEYVVPSWSVGRLIDIINNSTKLGYLVLYSSDILIERLIKVIENHSKFNEIDFSKFEE